MDTDNNAGSFLQYAQAYIDEKLSKGSLYGGGAGQGLIAAIKRTVEDSPYGFVKAYRQKEHFGETDQYLMLGVLSWVEENYGVSIDPTLKQYDYLSVVPNSKNYEISIEEVRRRIAGLTGTPRVVAALCSLGVKVCRLRGLKVEGNTLTRNGKVLFQLEENEVEFLQNLGVYTDPETWEELMEMVSRAADPTLSAAPVHQAWIKTGVVTGLTLDQIRQCYTISELKAKGIGCLKALAARLGVRPQSVLQNLDRWVRSGSITQTTYDTILGKEAAAA